MTRTSRSRAGRLEQAARAVREAYERVAAAERDENGTHRGDRLAACRSDIFSVKMALDAMLRDDAEEVQS